jgi:RsiW-degrading membrane proteinase PrsW (M82 family)
MNLIIIALAPVFIIAIYIYLRDKYEREPIRLLLAALAAGCVITIPVIFVEQLISVPGQAFNEITSAAWNAFAVAALTEELFKFLALYLLIWKNRHFNEKFDGIVYACFISLGFAGIENILYVSDGGFSVGITRAFTAVPAHALFGVIMGYQFGLARFYPEERFWRFFLALLIPILLHGIYDFILMSGHPYLLFAFIPYLVFLWIFGFRRIRQLSDRSIYRRLSRSNRKIRILFLLFTLGFLYCLPASSQSPRRGIQLPISNQNTSDLEFGYNGTYYLTANYDRLFFLKPVRYGPGVLLRAGLGGDFSPKNGFIMLTEAAYTTGYLTFVELGAGYNGKIYEGSWQHLPYFLAAFRYRANIGISIRLISRLMMNQSDTVPFFGAGLSVGFTF